MGSSPHTRGARVRLRRDEHHEGIIPAYAGSTGAVGLSSIRGLDHPRIRGEHIHPGDEVSVREGSSPHTRGARVHVFDDGVCGGIIPAYAGSTTATNANSRTDTDHPRIRGEHSLVHTDGVLKPGSSPHTRGARPNIGVSGTRSRIIPAYAGSTLPLAVWCALDEDHPRIRGEHRVGDPVGGEVAGSSPHTRGAPSATHINSQSLRIIPAYAGSTKTWDDDVSTSWDHPRIRGEHTVSAPQ